MRLLLLSSTNGGGHNACAEAIKQRFESNDCECVCIDAMRLVSPSVSRIASAVHVGVYRHAPHIFGAGYKYTEAHSRLSKGTPTYDLLVAAAPKLAKMISDGEYDVVICTHVFAAIMLTEAVEKYGCRAFTAFVDTDYTCTPGTGSSKLDAYFIPSKSLVEAHVADGIPREKITASGIPVREMFYDSLPGATAKALQGISPTGKHIVVMCGSMGAGPMQTLTRRIVRRLADDDRMTIVCGTNRRLCRKLKLLFKANENVCVKGFVRNVSALLDSADLYVTKPGGISTSEAAVKRLPMVLFNSVAGCETYNRDFYCALGAAKSAPNISQIAELCASLLADDRQTEAMRNAYDAYEVLHGNASEIIFNTVNSKVISRGEAV